MPEKNFLNLHALISHNPSCLNRDDMNMQKSAVFGGVRRVRISSQCLKRAMRTSDYWKNQLGERSIRTNDLDKLKERFAQAVEEPLKELVPEAVDRISGTGAYAKKSKADKKNARKGKDAPAEGEDAAPAAEDGRNAKKIAVAPWSVAEVKAVCATLADARKEGLKDGKLDKKIEEALKGAKEAFRHEAADIALFGRMTTAGAMTSVDGALSLAHVITTHAVEEDLDWFTAMDDLKEAAGADGGREEMGAGHLNTQEFGAGVFYRYASLNLRQLAENLGGATRADALQAGAHLARMLATVVPAAKQRSFAAHNPADFVMASLTDLPISAANAFERPVKAEDPGGFMAPSIKAFEDYMEGAYAGYGLGDEQSVFSLRETRLKPRVGKISELEDWIRGR